MTLADFDYELPPDRIAHHPARPRDSARLLHVRQAGVAGGLADRTIRDLPGLLRRGDILVVNDTRVFPAQLTARRGNAVIGLTLDRPRPDGAWKALARNARRVRPGDILSVIGAAPRGAEGAGRPVARVAAEESAMEEAATHGIATQGAATQGAATQGAATQGAANQGTTGEVVMTATVVEKAPDGSLGLRFSLDGEALMDAFRQAGVLALPPYIDRPSGPLPSDAQDYQTVFARQEGAVAAPTAGLHFTPRLLAELDAAGIRRATVTLHVGIGTFLPVRVDQVADHRMHAERGVITAEAAAAINAARAAGGRVVAVGTTSLRLLESAAAADGTLSAWSGETDLFILPGYRFKAVDRLVTNFHLPRSTLLMLVSAFAGRERMLAAYAHAVSAGYRFHSYGDACLLEPAAPIRR
ncbi:MAG TPA: tRNA preQ1(34) S-adenosylmethionine ribosyltransferase-isomerase QueA [Rhodopila sp.]|nr:tRNA preQ1(34) S-adenosylmethionine ribosyltransferase-isomerase QueA [Rhodopila sp.]HVZ08716.1 tRNA preQ1(34) S-adenosylmethionine ribosyltransferase-isomerase QueA [Rhodopila sp.]